MTDDTTKEEIRDDWKNMLRELYDRGFYRACGAMLADLLWVHFVNRSVNEGNLSAEERELHSQNQDDTAFQLEFCDGSTWR